MKLARWLAERRMTQAEFAARIGVTPDTVSLWVNEHKLPRRSRLATITRVTRGKVGPRDFPYKPRRRRGAASAERLRPRPSCGIRQVKSQLA